MSVQNALPRWRGFNLLEMFTTRSTGPFREEDFRTIADWGFDFVRLPLCYTLWCEGDDVCKLREDRLAMIDHAVELGRKYGIHVCINLHRAPGFSVNAERQEPFDLWKDSAALDAFCFTWSMLARRYKSIDSTHVSFNLVNEPKTPETDPAKGMTRADHERVMRRAIAEIRAIDPARLIILDGLNWGNSPSPELADLKVAQSCRSYAPFHLTHYKAHWCGDQKWTEPSWPFTEPWEKGKTWTRQTLKEHFAPWIELKNQGIGVHCGEGGAYHFTPHDVTLRWMEDWLTVLQENNIGWALWNLRGSFGVMDSLRPDVQYEQLNGHQLDRKMLDLLRRF